MDMLNRDRSHVQVEEAAAGFDIEQQPIHYEYIFGFGSIMNTTTHATWQTPGKEESSVIPGAVATITKCFGYKRKWNFRSFTGFTALGVVSSEYEASDINGVLFQVPRSEMSNFDRREVGYERVEVPLKFLEFHPRVSGSTSQLNIGSNAKIWLYVPIPSHNMSADENHPLLQSYVDTVLQGCLEWGGEDMAEDFILSTGGWSCFYLNDTPSSRRPWLFRKQYATIDELLSKHSQLTHYGDRRHPEEFASAFNQRMKGTWSIPRRNPNFTGRDHELDEIQSRFSAMEMGGQQIISKVEVAGMGGVGKTQLVAEYCYRHFPRDYGLVVWLNAETIDSLITDFRQLLADLANVDADMDKSSDEIVEEVRTRLFRSNVPWLIVFDNAESSSLEALAHFVPRGAGTKGHVLVTTRHVIADSSGTLILGCLRTNEAIELLRRSAGSHNMDGSSNAAAAEVLSEKLGNLPLALSMAAAYMRRCEVECSEYLHRYTASEKSGQSLLRRGPGATTVASILSLLLPKIEEENQITSEVLHLLSFVGPDVITKSLLRNLISAKKNYDEKISERNTNTLKKQLSVNGPLPACIILGGVALLLMSPRMLPAIDMQRAALIVLASTASSIFVLSMGAASEKANTSSNKQVTSTSRSFSAFEYEQSDVSWDILKSFSLLSVKEGKGSVHRLLAAAMRSCQSQEESLYYITICIDAMVSCWMFKADSTESWKSSLQLLDHVKTIVAHSQEYNIDSLRLLTVARLSKEAGVLSAMALNAFVEAQVSIEVTLKLLERSTMAKKPECRKAKAEALYELSKIHRYQGRYDDANKCLMESLDLNNADGFFTADTLHELGILEIKRHNLDAATSFLQQSLEIRRGLDDRNSDQVNASATLHQLAAVHVARKPPSLDKAKVLLQEALGLSRQIGQRAATIKQLARVTIRQGFLDQAESYLDQALELYRELYGDNKLHINIAAVRFQQGALALQRSRLTNDKAQSLDNAWLCFHDCLRIRRHVYAYASPLGHSSEDTDPIHLEVSCVLHELGSVGLTQKRFTQSMKMLEAERAILVRLAETAPRSERIYQARLTNLTWLRKCTKEMGDDIKSASLSDERLALKIQFGLKCKSERNDVSCESNVLKEKAKRCRWMARRFALDKSDSETHRKELLKCLAELKDETRTASPGPMAEAASQFLETLLRWLDQSGGGSEILAACDSLRNVLRAHGVQVNDSIHPRNNITKDI